MATTPDLTSENDVSKSHIFKHIVSDNSTGSVGNNASETEIGEATIAASTITHGILVLVRVKMTAAYEDGQCTAKIRVGTSATATSNTEITEYVHNISQTNSGANDDSLVNVTTTVTMMGWYTGATWSSENFVHVTGATNNASSAQNAMVLQDIEVFGF